MIQVGGGCVKYIFAVLVVVLKGVPADFLDGVECPDIFFPVYLRSGLFHCRVIVELSRLRRYCKAGHYGNHTHCYVYPYM